MEFDRLDRASEEELLKLEGSPETEDLERAFEARQTEWQKKRAMVEAEKTLVTKVEVIQERLKKAYERMREESLSSETETTAEASPPPADVDADAFEVPTEQTLPPLNEELFEEVGIDISADDVTAPSSELGDTQPPEREQPSAADAPAGVGHEDERAEQSRDSEDVEDSEPSEEIGAAIVEETPPEEEAGAAGPQLTGAARADRVRQLQRDVKLHFQVRDWEHAVSLLYELVELEPDVAKHHGMLARAMARHPVMRKDAERHFIEALRLAPQDADLHYSLGLYYKSFGMHARAQNEFRTALRIRPQHEGAQKHLSATSKGGKDPLKDMFKKIFG